MWISSFTTRTGQSVQLARVVVLFGPNNTGKSETLRDLYRLLTNTDPLHTGDAAEDTKTFIVDDFQYDPAATYDQFVLGQRVVGEGGEAQLQALGPTLGIKLQATFDPEKWRNILRRRPLTARSVWRSGMANLMLGRVAFLDLETRLRAGFAGPAGSPAEAPENLLQLLQFAPPAVHDELDTAFAAAFDDLHLRLDDTARVKLALRVAPEFPERPADPGDAVRRFRQLRPLDGEGDGLRSFTSILMTMLLAPGRVVLLDSPEAHLHPDQARKLAVWVAKAAKRTNSQVIVATQSEPILGGLLAGTSEIVLQRVTRRRDGARFTTIPAEPARRLAYAPPTAHQRALDCLFFHGAILTPTDDERSLYRAVAHREFGASNVAFLHAYGQENLPQLVRLLRDAGLPLCTIANLDLLANRESFHKLIESLTGAPPQLSWSGTRDRMAAEVERAIDRQNIKAHAKEVEAFLSQFGPGDDEDDDTPEAEASADAEKSPAADPWNAVRQKGLAALSPELRPWVEQLLDELRPKGLFVVAKGGLRSWLEPTADGEGGWFLRALTQLQTQKCPVELRAFVADVLNFLRARQTVDTSRPVG